MGVGVGGGGVSQLLRGCNDRALGLGGGRIYGKRRSKSVFDPVAEGEAGLGGICQRTGARPGIAIPAFLSGVGGIKVLEAC